MRTLNSECTIDRRTALIGLELKQYSIDIAALCETRFAESGQLTEDTSGYTYFWSGLPATDKRLHGVALVLRTPLADKLETLPKAVNERLITLRMPVNSKRYVTIIGAYAPTMTNEEPVKEQFYNDLSTLIVNTPKEDKLIILGDFNARVGSDHASWPKTIGRHGIGNCNSNGQLLLSTCQEHSLTITNTVFQLPAMHKNTWMHPRSKNWHLIDYVIVRSRDLQDVTITRVMRGAECQTDHRMVRSVLKLVVKPPVNKRTLQPVRKLNVVMLNDPVKRKKFQVKLENSLSALQDDDGVDVTAKWNKLRTVLSDTSSEVLGTVKRKQPDWFADSITLLQPLIEAKNKAHQTMNDRNTRSTKSKFAAARRVLQQQTRQIKDKWLRDKACQIQEYADTHDTRKFYHAVKELYGPSIRGTTPLLSTDEQTLKTDHTAILKRWEGHFGDLLNRPSTVDLNSIDAMEQKPVLHEIAGPPSKNEILKAIKGLQSGKAPGEDGIPGKSLSMVDRHFLISCTVFLG